jgi:Domain of unknown function (DUF5666)
MTEQRWRRPEPGAKHRSTTPPPHPGEQVAVADTDAETAPLPAYEEDMTAPVDHDDLAAELAAAAPRRWWNKATLYLGAAALLVGGFVAGAQVQQKYGEPSTPAAGARSGANANAANAGRFGGYFGGQVPGGAQAGGAQTQSGTGSTAAATPTTGKVKLVDGTTVYVETSSGDVVTVRTNGQTKVQAATSSSLKNLAVGDSVTVQGQSSTDGTVTASTVTETK